MMKLSDMEQVRKITANLRKLQGLLVVAEHGHDPDRHDIRMKWRCVPIYTQSGSANPDSSFIEFEDLEGPIMAIMKQRLKKAISELKEQLRDLGVELEEQG
jgi:hypothetical protein